MNQAELPRGVGGRLLGRVMALVNADMERAAGAQLGLDGSERVPAVGFRAGVGRVHLTRQIGPGNAAGIEPSAVMLDHTRRRLSQRGLAGVELALAPVEQIPCPDESFNTVSSVNNVQFWDYRRALAELDGCSAFWVGSCPALLISWWAVIVDRGSPECKRRISFCFSRRLA